MRSDQIQINQKKDRAKKMCTIGTVQNRIHKTNVMPLHLLCIFLIFISLNLNVFHKIFTFYIVSYRKIECTHILSNLSFEMCLF